MQSVFITATDTGVGKTYFSKKIIGDLIDKGSYSKEEIVYYKPIQCGEELVEGKTQTDFSNIHDSLGVDVFCSYFLRYPCSPHYAAELEGVEIRLDKIISDFESLKSKYKFVLVEGAGGLAVPLNNIELVSDIALALSLPLVIVIRPDLGTINHSLLTIEYAKNKNLNILGLLITKPNACGEKYSISGRDFIENQHKNSIKTILDKTELNIFDINLLKADVTSKIN